MKLEHLFLGICLLLLAATGLMAVHYRTELLVERERTAHLAGPSTVAPAVTPAPAPAPAAVPATAPVAAPTASLDREAARVDAENRQLREKLASEERKMLDAKVEQIKAAGAGTVVEEPKSDLQVKIKEAPAIAKIKAYLSNESIATLDAGTDRGLKTDQVYAVRRGHFIVAKKITIGETVEASECAAIVDPNSLQPGQELKPGDEVIKWDGI